MRKTIQYVIVTACLAFFQLGYADGSTLYVTNNVPGIAARITTDLACGAYFDTVLWGHFTRYTSPLKENPILYNQGQVKATWRLCMLLPEEFFVKHHLTMHNKIYLNLLDTNNGDQFVATINTTYGKYTREILFSNYRLSLTVDFQDTHKPLTGPEVIIYLGSLPKVKTTRPEGS